MVSTGIEKQKDIKTILTCVKLYSMTSCHGFSGLGIPSSVFRANRSFLPKNEQIAKKMRDSLICSFLVSDLSDSLTIAHFL